MADSNAAYEWIKKDAVPDSRGVYRIPQAKYMSYLKTQGWTEELVKSWYATHSDITNGLIQFNGDKVEEMAKKIKKEGREPNIKDDKVHTAISTYHGTMHGTTYACRVHANPANREQVILRPGAFDLHWDQKRMIDRDIQAAQETRIAKALGIENK